MIFSDIASIDATISYKSNNCFWEVFNRAVSIQEAASRGDVQIRGSESVIEDFQRKLNRLSDMTTTDTSANHTDHNSVASPKNRLATSQRPGDSSETALKHGWLMKKRDIFSGWRHRYVVVYTNRVDYYVDQCDLHPRETIPLAGCEILEPRKFKYNGTPNYWYIV